MTDADITFAACFMALGGTAFLGGIAMDNSDIRGVGSVILIATMVFYLIAAVS